MILVNCIYFRYKKGNYFGETGDIPIHREEMDSVCSLFRDMVPISSREESGNLYLQYDNCILVIENYPEFKKTPYFKYFEEKVVKPVNTRSITLVFNYKKDPNLISQINMVDYADLAEKFGYKYGIDPNLITAVMANNSLNHTYEVNERDRVGIMNVPYERVSRDLTYDDYEKGISGKRSFSLDELTDMGTNIEAWCILFQNYLRDNNFNILVALELINEDYANTVYNAVLEYTKDKYRTNSVIEPHDDLDSFYYQLGVKDLKDINWLGMLMDDNGKVYSEEVLAYYPDITSFRFKLSKEEDLVVNIQNTYKKEIKNT